MAEDFLDRFAGWGRWGVSAFYARGEIEVDDIASTRLRRFRLVRVYPTESPNSWRLGSRSCRPFERLT